jgi:hypothetical protein
MGSSQVGEFASEEQAEAVRDAFEFLHAPRAYLMVKRTFDLDTQAQHADSQEEADAFVAAKLAEGEEWRVFSRVLTDPVAKALYLVRPAASAVPAGVYVGSGNSMHIEPAGTSG